ncbi:MAG: methylated-DNA--[protein]-cysteine S-methyltransferase [Pseudomonadota bacterium]
MGRYALISSKRGVVLLKPEDRMGNRLEAWQGEGIRLHDGKDYHRQVATELDAYFSGRLRDFSVPLDLRGTDFQRRIWDLLLKIPYGETRTYGQIARAVGDPKAGRAVGHANGRNPVSIIVPCHRVIGVKGKLVGYGGGLDRKKALIDLEARFRG